MFSLRKKGCIVLCIVLSVVVATQSMAFKVSAATLSKSVTQYSSYFLVDAKNENQIGKIQAAGNLSGRATASDPWISITGWFDYQITTDTTGWYELILTCDPTISGGDRHEFILDGTTYLNPFPKTLTTTTSKVGNVWLVAGTHTFRIQRWVWTGFGAIKSFEFKPVSTSLEKNIRVTQDVGTTYGANGSAMFLKNNETFNLNVYSGGSATGTFNIEVYNKATNILEKTYTTTISSSASESKQTVAISCANAGTYYLKYKAAGSYVVSTEGLLDVEFTVIDATPVDVTGNLNDVIKTQVGSEINCAATTPNYVAGSNDSVFGEQQRVVNASFGSFRETGNNGYLASKTNPNYVAYTMPTLYPDKHYMAEIDYPDDSERNFAIVLRQDGETYGMAGGVDTGYEYPVTNSIKTFSFNFYMIKQGQPRIGVMAAQGGLRAAVSKIRIYEVTDNPSLKASSSGRDFGFYFEEGQNYSYLFGAKDSTKEENMKAAERWAQNMRYLGGNVMFPTTAVYQQSLSPSANYDLMYSDLHTSDYFKMLLIYAEKYSLNVVADFHRSGNEMTIKSKYTANYRKNWLMSKTGAYLLQGGGETGATLNPIYPDNQNWMDGYLTEFANKYENMTSFKGISIRSMKWSNTGFTNFENLNYGYDDYTAGQFCAFLGIADPGTPSARYSAFTNATYKQKWIDWRASKINEAMQRYTNTLKAVRADLVLYSVVDNGMLDKSTGGIEEAGIKDNKIDGFQWIYGGYQYGRRSTSSNLTTAHADWDKNKTYLTDNDYFLSLPSSPCYNLWANYLEDGGQCMKAADLGLTASSAWISAHVVPAGRNYLERYATALAKADAQLLLNGGNTYFYDQPIVREFMQEYRQLPKEKFNLINTINNDVVVRDYQGTDYDFYLVNQTSAPKTCVINFGQAQTITQLSTGAQTSTTNNKITITLEAYQVKVFKSQGAKIIDADGIKSGPIALYKLDDASGAVAKDSSGNNNAGILNNGPIWNTNVGQKKGALDFDGINDNISCGNKVGSADEMSVSFWAKADALKNSTVASKLSSIGTAGFDVKLRNDGSLVFRIGSESSFTDVSYASAYTVGSFVHVVCTFKAGTAKIYINGILQVTQSGIMQTVNNATEQMTIGSNCANGENFDGLLDDIYIYNREVTSTEVAALCNINDSVLITDDFEAAAVSNAMWETVDAAAVPSTMSTDYSVDTANGNSYLHPVFAGYDPKQSYITTIKDSVWSSNKLDEFETKELLPAIGNNKYTNMASNIFLYFDPITKESISFGYSLYSGALTGYVYNTSGMTVVNKTNYSTGRGGYPIDGFSTANWMTVNAKYDYSVVNTITVLLTFTNGRTISTCSFSFSPVVGSLASGFKIGFGSLGIWDPSWLTYYDDVKLYFEKSAQNKADEFKATYSIVLEKTAANVVEVDRTAVMAALLAYSKLTADVKVLLTSQYSLLISFMGSNNYFTSDDFSDQVKTSILWETVPAITSQATLLSDAFVSISGNNSYVAPAVASNQNLSYVTTIKDELWNPNKLQSFEAKVKIPGLSTAYTYNNAYDDAASNIYLYYDKDTEENIRLKFSLANGAPVARLACSPSITANLISGFAGDSNHYFSGFSTTDWLSVKVSFDYSIVNKISLTLIFTYSNGSFSTCVASFNKTSGFANSFKVGIGSVNSNIKDAWAIYYDDIKVKFAGLTQGGTVVISNPVVVKSVVNIGDVITNIQPSMLVSAFKGLISNGSVFIKNALDVDITNTSSALVGTGTTAEITVNSVPLTYTVVVYGDVTGDGVISVFDLVAVKRHLLKSVALTGAKKTAGDLSEKGTISISDLLAIKKVILGLGTISQNR